MSRTRNVVLVQVICQCRLQVAMACSWQLDGAPWCRRKRMRSGISHHMCLVDGGDYFMRGVERRLTARQEVGAEDTCRWVAKQWNGNKRVWTKWRLPWSVSGSGPVKWLREVLWVWLGQTLRHAIMRWRCMGYNGFRVGHVAWELAVKNAQNVQNCRARWTCATSSMETLHGRCEQ